LLSHRILDGFLRSGACVPDLDLRRGISKIMKGLQEG
jgi:hypothetical protein